MASQPRESVTTGPTEDAGPPAHEWDSVVRIGWKVPDDYDRGAVEHLLVKHYGLPVAYVRYVALPAPAWWKRPRSR